MTILLAVVLLLLSGLASLVVGRDHRLAGRVGSGGIVAACSLGLAATLAALANDTVERVVLPWHPLLGSLHLRIDALSCWFLLPVFGLTLLAALYGEEYLGADRDRYSAAPPWVFLALLAAGMVTVLVSWNGALFLVAWEVMSVSAFFLVTHDHERKSVQEAGWTYLVATHLGTAFLLAFFILVSDGSFDFDRIRMGASSGVLFVLAVVGFGAKAGLVPFHVWLPEAHPAAPSHVSALMSGVMIKTGLYGILRTVTLLGPPEPWWGWLLLVLGLVSGIMGAVGAVAQTDLKRLLAYCSVENVGLMTMAAGLGVLGLASGNPGLAALGLSAALVHMASHAVAKGLLFLSAGAVLHATGTGSLDRLGGLLRSMPRTGAAFVVGAATVVGLPPLAGFVGEFLLVLAALRAPGAAAALVVGALALMGCLAAAAFCKAIGVGFLGEPRFDHGREAHDPGPGMMTGIAALGVACILMGLGAPAVASLAAPAAAVVVGASAAALPAAVMRALGGISVAGGVLVVTVAIVALLRAGLLAGRDLREGPTWDCGFSAPTARMQYTSASFAQPLADLFAALLRRRRVEIRPAGLFPSSASLTETSLDPVREGFYRPIFGGVASVLHRLRWLQHGRLHLYVLTLVVTLVALMMWTLR